MFDGTMSPADFAAMSGNDGFGNGNSWIWLLIILLFLGGGTAFGGNGNGNVVGQKAATSDEVYNATNNQSLFNRLDGIQNGITTSAYENAQLINSNANMLNQSINSGFDGISRQLSECCCNLKTQMLQDKYDDVRNQLNLAEIASANAVQTQNILGQIGRFVTNPPCYNNYGCGCNGYYNGTTIA